MTTPFAARPPVVDTAAWQRELEKLRVREKAATRELDAIAAQRRRLPMVELDEYTLTGRDGPVRLADVFDGAAQLIVYHHMWSPGAEWQCGGCTSYTSQFTRLDFLAEYDARFVVVTQGPIEEALAYRARVGNRMDWYSTAGSAFGKAVGAPPGGGFAVNVLLRDGDTVYRTWHTDGRGVEQLSHTFPLVDVLPYGRREPWQDSPEGWPQTGIADGWLDSSEVAALYGQDPAAAHQDEPGAAVSPEPAEERFVVDRVLDATAQEIFALLADPVRHHETEPTGWVGAAIDPAPITRVGQVFGMRMAFPDSGEPYRMDNRVIVWEPDRAIAWEPGQYAEDGTLQTGGWTWRYDLVAEGERTRVSLTYDWSASPAAIRAQIGGLPPFGPEFLERSLRALERAVLAGAAQH